MDKRTSIGSTEIVGEAIEEAVFSLFKSIFDRMPTGDERKFFCRTDKSLKDLARTLLTVDPSAVQARQNKINGKLPLTLAIFAKDNEDSIHLPLENMGDHVREIIVVDTGSTDNTIQVAEALGARVYKIGFTDFGSIRTITGHLATQPWVLGLDSDEILDPEEIHLLNPLLNNTEVMAWGLPRRRWADLDRTVREEEEAYPDFQYRLFRNRPDILSYTNRVHERLVCSEGEVESAPLGPHIEHFQSPFKTGERLSTRNALYTGFHAADQADGVGHTVPPVAELDEV